MVTLYAKDGPDDSIPDLPPQIISPRKAEELRIKKDNERAAHIIARDKEIYINVIKLFNTSVSERQFKSGSFYNFNTKLKLDIHPIAEESSRRIYSKFIDAANKAGWEIVPLTNPDRDQFIHWQFKINEIKDKPPAQGPYR